MSELSDTNDASVLSTLKTLLVPYDFFEASDAALSWAIEIAEVFDSKIIVLCIENPNRLGDRMEGDPKSAQARRDAQESLQGLQRRLEHADVRCDVIQRTGVTGDILVQEVSDQRADLVLMGAYGSRRLDPPRLGSTADAMIRAMACGVFVIGPESAAHPPHFDALRRILYLKISDQATPRLPLLEEIAEKSRAVIEIECLVRGGFNCDPSRHQKLQTDCERLAMSLRAQHFPVCWNLQYGGEDTLLPSISRLDLADLTVIDAADPTPKTRRTLNLVIQNSRCPVLVLPREQLRAVPAQPEALAAVT
ncbi:MAG: universal stress protein [Acidobacteriota bacterium]